MRKRIFHYIPYPPNDISKQGFKNYKSRNKIMLEFQIDLMEWKMALTASEH